MELHPSVASRSSIQFEKKVCGCLSTVTCIQTCLHQNMSSPSGVIKLFPSRNWLLATPIPLSLQLDGRLIDCRGKWQR